jgi:hypothetical protein
MKTILTTNERINRQPTNRFTSAVRNSSSVAISPTEMNTSFKTAEMSSERPDQQSKEVFGMAVREINPATISPMKPINTTTTTDLGECGCTAELGALPDITSGQAAAGHVEKGKEMSTQATVNNEGAATNRGRFGVGATNLIELKDSTPELRKFRFKLKAKGFSFWSEAESTGNQGWVVKWPWPKSVRIEASDEQKVIEEQVLEKLKQAFSEFDLATAA